MLKKKSTQAKKIVILGGCGYIGSKLYLDLIKDGFSVDTVDLEWYGNYVNKKNIKKNYSVLPKKFFATYDVIILLAGYSSVKLCSKNTQKSFKNDVINFLQLLEKISDQRFIYASSSSVYQNTKQKTVTEEYSTYSPSNYYDLNKRVIDYYAQLSKLDYYGLRFGTVCGYSPQLRADLLINKIYLDAEKNRTIEIYNPNIHRPVLGITDLTKAIKKIIISKKNRPGIYNLASFNGTIESIGKEIGRSLHKNVTTEFAKREQIHYNFSVSTKKFEQEFNFTFKEDTVKIVRSLIKNRKNIHASLRG